MWPRHYVTEFEQGSGGGGKAGAAGGGEAGAGHRHLGEVAARATKRLSLKIIKIISVGLRGLPASY